MVALPDHPHLNLLKNLPVWTVSDNTKRPIDMVTLASGGPIVGAKHRDHRCLVTCNDIDTLLPNAANHALWLDVDTRGFVIVDVESYASDQTKTDAINLAHRNGWYVETSLSGRGVHVLVPISPELVASHQFAARKPVLKDGARGFEILHRHFCTFTGNVIAPVGTVAEAVDPDFATGESLWLSLAQHVVPSEYDPIDWSTYKSSALPDGEAQRLEPLIEKVTRICTETNPYTKHPSDFDNDMSRFEFGLMGFIYNRMWDTIYTHGLFAARKHMSPLQEAYTLWQIATHVIEHRPKHDGVRNGQPYLLYTACQIVDRARAKKAQNTTNINNLFKGIPISTREQ